MTWMGSWMGGGTGSAPAPAVRADRRPRNALEWVLFTLQVEFATARDGIPRIPVSLGQGLSGGPGTLLIKIDDLTAPGNMQSIRMSMQMLVQHPNQDGLERVHEHAICVLEDQEFQKSIRGNVRLISIGEGADVFDDETGDRGVFQRATNLVVRS